MIQAICKINQPIVISLLMVSRFEGNDMVVEGEGTGFVHMAGGCGAIDNKICKREGFVEISPIDNQANFIQGFDFMSGLSVTDPELLKNYFQFKRKRSSSIC